MKVTERFSDRVENYIKYRPHYPSEIIPFLEKKIGLSPSSVIADIGSGTGISAEIFLKKGNTVFGIEPNKEMREAGETFLKQYPNFQSLDAAAESTTLAGRSIDIIIAGQAFHWFDVQKAQVEFNRILRSGGWVVLIWNERKTETTPFLLDYEKLLHTFGTDYRSVNHINSHGSIKDLFIENGYQRMNFPNSQSFDYEGLEGRLLSSSYTPIPDDPKYRPMLGELRRMFDTYENGGRVEIFYTTELYYGQL